MTTQYSYKNQYYYTLDTRFNVNGVLFGAGASAIEVAIGSLLSYGKGNAVTQSMKFLIKEGVASEVITTSVEIGFNNEIVTINGVIVNFVGELAVQNLLTAIITSVLGASAATGFVNIVAIAAASSLIWSAATAIGEEINTEVDAFYNDVAKGSLVDLKFVNSSGDHTSGFMVPSETYGVLGIKGSIIAYLNNSSENVDGGYLTFADGRDGDQLTGTAYQIFNGSTFQAIANKLEISLEQFLSSGISGSSNNDLYISGFNKVAFAKTADITSSSKIYIPLKINGVTQIIAVDGVFNSSESLNNLLVGRSSEVIFGTSKITYPDALILDSNYNAPIIVRTGRSEGQEEGNYIIIGSDGADNLSVYKSAIIDGGDGIDTIDYSSLNFGSRDIEVNLANHTATNGISINSFTNTLYNIENIIGSNGNDSIAGDSKNNNLSGGDGDDNISGEGGRDILDGGTGEDALTGGSGNDILKGSTGFDSYNFSGNYGLDTIIDSDQNGRIIINGIIFEGTATIVEVASTKSYSTYEMQSGGKSYILVASNGSLLISDSINNSVNNLLQNQIVIKNFSNGNFGITLDNTDDEEPNPDTSSPDTSNPNSILQNFKDYFRDLLDDNDNTQNVGDYIEDLLNSLTRAEATPFNNPRYDPLTLDLDGDGVELVSLNKSTAFFDLDNDALREKVGWVKADDGILVLDSNNNNSVDNITELFGYRREDGVQVTGTEELRTHDSNNDGKIDANDSIFSKLKIWQDANQNGISEVNELKTLSDYSITSINVAQSKVTDLNQLQEGNLIISKSTYTKTVTNNDGTTTEVTRDYANLDLAIDQTNSSSYSYQDESGNNVTYNLNLDVLNLPMSRGYGNLKAWHVAMSEDETLISSQKLWVEINSLN